MGFLKPCAKNDGRVLCKMYRGGRRFAFKADNFLKDYGQDIGHVAAQITPIATAYNPALGAVTANIGAFASEYSRIRNEMGN